MKQTYAALIEQQRKEINDFPIAYAFGKKQAEEALVTLGVSSFEECTTVFGHGDIVTKENAPKLVEMMKRHTREVKEALLADEDFAESAFLYEMDNHEYAINWDGDDEVLSCFGMDYDDLKKMGLENAYRRARQRHMKFMRENGVV